jgi:metallo-beta-lactamase family protein
MLIRRAPVCAHSGREVRDAGIFDLLRGRGRGDGGREAAERNAGPWGFVPSELDFVVLTHAHIDHSGLLPRLVREGFRGPVYATPATVELIDVMLRDSAHLIATEAERARRHAQQHRAREPIAPLYGLPDVATLMAQLKAVRSGAARELAPGIQLNFHDAGHILGSAIAELTLRSGAGELRVVASGDLGQPGRPIMRDPAVLRSADVLLCESTYGDRDHKPLAPTLDELVDAVTRTLRKKHGNVLVPSFAVGRTQELLYWFERLALDGQLPELEVFVDSPLANEVSAITARHFELFDEEARRLFAAARARPRRMHLRHVHSVSESMALNRIAGGAVIVAASGMCDGGRIRHHLRHRLADARTTVLITGYQARGTLGRRLVEHDPVVTIMGDQIPVRAEIVTLGGFSAHADQTALVGWLGHFEPRPRRTFLVHGEPAAAEALRARLERELGWVVAVARLGERVALGD